MGKIEQILHRGTYPTFNQSNNFKVDQIDCSKEKQNILPCVPVDCIQSDYIPWQLIWERKPYPLTFANILKAIEE